MKKNLLLAAMALLAVVLMTSCTKKAPEIDKSATPKAQMEQVVKAINEEGNKWSNEDKEKMTTAFCDAYAAALKEAQAMIEKEDVDGASQYMADTDLPALQKSFEEATVKGNFGADPKTSEIYAQKIKEATDAFTPYAQKLTEMQQAAMAAAQGGEDAAPEGEEEVADEEVAE